MSTKEFSAPIIKKYECWETKDDTRHYKTFSTSNFYYYSSQRVVLY